MPVNPTLRLVIEFVSPNAEYRFKKFYQRQDLKLDLGNCEIFTARLVSMEEYTPPRETELVEECNSLGAQIADRLSSIVSSSSIITMDNPGMKEYLNIIPTWTVVLTNTDTGFRDSFGMAKCTRQAFMDIIQSRYPDMGDLVLALMEDNTLYFLTAKDIGSYCREYDIKPLNLDLIFDKWLTPTL